jgi:hypothetical protein
MDGRRRSGFNHLSGVANAMTGKRTGQAVEAATAPISALEICRSSPTRNTDYDHHRCHFALGY